MIRSALGSAIVISVFTLAASSPGAARQPGTHVQYGHIPSCGSWTEQANKHWSRGNALETWVWGFVSGAGFAFAASDVELTKTDAEALSAWITSYCASRPLDPLGAAAIALTKELRARKLAAPVNDSAYP